MQDKFVESAFEVYLMDYPDGQKEDPEWYGNGFPASAASWRSSFRIDVMRSTVDPSIFCGVGR
jgi:hypothetical protein